MNKKINIYDLSRNFFNWSFENPEKISPLHTALYFFAIEHCNRLGWKEKFGLPTEMAKEAIGIKSWHTYINAFNDLVEWGFFKLIEKSKNQFSSNIIALSKNDEALDEALDNAMTKHLTTHTSKQVRSTHQSNDSINKQIYNITNLPNTNLQEKNSLSNFDIDFLKNNNEYFPIVEKWYKYKIEIRSPITTQMQLEAFCKELWRMSSGKLNEAEKLIDYNISRNYKNLYEPDKKQINEQKSTNNGSKTGNRFNPSQAKIDGGYGEF